MDKDLKTKRTKTTDEHFWNQCARFYTGLQKRNAQDLYIALTKRIEPHLQAYMSVLELGCGTGQLSFPLAPLVKEWVATDFSSNMIEQFKKRILPNNLYPLVQDATDLPYESARFDAVVVANTLHIMPEPEKAVLEAYRVLRQDGLLIAPTFIRDIHQNRCKLWLMERFGFHIYNNWTVKAFSNFIQQFHFSIESIQVIPGNPSSECLLIARKQGSY